MPQLLGGGPSGLLIAVTTAIKRRRRRELVYSCGEIEILPSCTEASLHGGGILLLRGVGAPGGGRRSPPAKRGIIFLLWGVALNFPLLAGGELLQPDFEDFWRLDLCCHQETWEDSSFIVSQAVG